MLKKYIFNYATKKRQESKNIKKTPEKRHLLRKTPWRLKTPEWQHCVNVYFTICDFKIFCYIHNVTANNFVVDIIEKYIYLYIHPSVKDGFKHRVTRKRWLF